MRFELLKKVTSLLHDVFRTRLIGASVQVKAVSGVAQLADHRIPHTRQL